MRRDEIRNQIIEERGERTGQKRTPLFHIIHYQEKHQIFMFFKAFQIVLKDDILSEYSPVIDALIGYMEVIGIYITPKFRNSACSLCYLISKFTPYETNITRYISPFFYISF